MTPKTIIAVLLLAGGALPVAAAVPAKTAAPAGWYHPGTTQLRGLPFGPFVRLPDGKILAVDVPRDVVTSSDEGKTWQRSPMVLPGADFEFRPEKSLLRTRSGVLILAFVNKRDDAGFKWDSKLRDSPGAKRPTYVTRSVDDGRTWEPPQKLHEEWTGALRDIIQTRDGTVVFTSMKMLHDPGRHSVLTYSSTDDGRSWRRSNIIDLGGAGHHSGAVEATLEELRDGRLRMLIRTNWKFFWEAISEDAGQSWRTIHPTTIDTSSSPGLLKRLQSGRLILIWNRCYPENDPSFAFRDDRDFSEVPASVQRGELSLMLSADDGKSWTKPVVISRLPRGGFAYPNLFEIQPGELWVTTNYGSLRVRLFEKDFLGGP